MTTTDQSIEDDKMSAVIAELMAETGKLNKETPFYTVIVATTVLGGLTAIIGASAALFTVIYKVACG